MLDSIPQRFALTNIPYFLWVPESIVRLCNSIELLLEIQLVNCKSRKELILEANVTIGEH